MSSIFSGGLQKGYKNVTVYFILKEIHEKGEGGLYRSIYKLSYNVF